MRDPAVLGHLHHTLIDAPAAQGAHQLQHCAVPEVNFLGAAFELNPLADQIHILTSCDVVLSSDPRPLPITGLRCPPMVTHADGTVVSAAKPAQAGEQLVAWAVGLGYTDPAPVTGQPSGKPLTVSTRLDIDYSFRPNALPVKPQPTVSILIFPNPFAVSAVLAQGFVGLYQINFATPQAPVGTPACAAGSSGLGGNAIESNLTVSFGGGFSFDGAGICVAIAKP